MDNNFELNGLTHGIQRRISHHTFWYSCFRGTAALCDEALGRLPRFWFNPLREVWWWYCFSSIPRSSLSSASASSSFNSSMASSSLSHIRPTILFTKSLSIFLVKQATLQMHRTCEREKYFTKANPGQNVSHSFSDALAPNPTYPSSWFTFSSSSRSISTIPSVVSSSPIFRKGYRALLML